MITLTINKKNVKIPVMDEMTVKQYIKFTKTGMGLVHYLSVMLKKDYKEAFNMKLQNSDKLKHRLGELKNYTKEPLPKKLILNNELFFIKNIEISTVGQRFMIEENAKNLKNEELLCFILAVGIVKDPMNIDDIKKVKKKLMNESYIKVLPLAFFLGSRFLHGRNNVMSFLLTFRQSVNTIIYRNKQVLRSLLTT